MAKHNVITTDEKLDSAIKSASSSATEPLVTRVDYRPGRGLDLFILQMNDGHRCVLPREDLQGLEGASREEAANVQILGKGTGLHWPSLDVAMYVPALLQGVYGTRRWMADLGRRGGLQTSRAKQRSARANGKKGGRPRLQKTSIAA